MLQVSEEIISRIKIRIDTDTDVVKFVGVATKCPPEMILHVIDDNGMCIEARSILGVMYAREFKHMWLVSNNDKIHTIFAEFARN